VLRDAGYVQTVVLEILEEYVTQYVRPVTEVFVIETITILPHMTYRGNTTHNSTTNGTYHGNTTASARFTLPASLDPMAHHGPTGTGTSATNTSTVMPV